MTEYVRDGGIWKPAKDLHVRDAGVWKRQLAASVKDAGVWKRYHTTRTATLVDKFEATGSSSGTITRTVSLGTADETRTIVVLAGHQRTISAVIGGTTATLGGNNMSLIFSSTPNYMPMAGYSIRVPSGTSASLVLAPGIGFYGSTGVLVYAIYGLNSITAVDVDTTYLNNTTGSPILTSTVGNDYSVMLCAENIYRSNSYSTGDCIEQGSAPAASREVQQYNSTYAFEIVGWLAPEVPAGSMAWQYTYPAAAYRRLYQCIFY